MPRLGTEASSSRRHNPQPLSGYHQTSSNPWTTRGDPPKRGESSSSVVTESSDPPDDFVGRSRASNSRTRWNARTSGSPYGSRPLSKHLPAESQPPEEMDMLVDLVPERDSDNDVEETRQGGTASSEVAADDDDDDVVDAPDSELETDPGAIDPTDHVSHPDAPLSGTAVKKREKNKKKRAKARAKAKEKEEIEATAPETIPLPPHDLLASMSRIAKLIDSLNAGASSNNPRALLRRLQDTLSLDGRTVSPEQWRAEVLRSVRRMEGMLGQIDKWQTQVAPAEIEALRQETARLEVRVRAVVEQEEEELTTTRGKGKERADVDVLVTEAEESSREEMVLRPGTPSADSDDSVSDSHPDSSSCPSDCDTGPTEPDPDDRSPVEEKTIQVEPPAPAPTPPPAASIPTSPIESTHAPPSPVSEAQAPSAEAPSPTDGPVIPSLASKNLNVPPEPPQDPVEYLAQHPWSMLEVLLLLEVVAHFPPAEHGWTFVTEAYNNLLITRPLQEWFGKQAAISNEEEVKMKTLLQNMNAEARQLRARPTTASALAKPPSAGPAPKAKAGERGKASQFGSAEAHAEANARAKTANAPAKAAASGPSEPAANAAKDAQIVTRLPFPLDDSIPASAPPPAQRTVSFPRRRPPFTLPSEDAKQFTRIMRSAAAGVRPPSTDSRAAMLILYSATKSRFPVRAAWDCWHRWCTPWVVQDPPTEGSDHSLVVVDYIAGNLGAPCGTSWTTQAQAPTFEYHPVPGTYPDAPGVQHRVSARYDPRPGMVAFARMTHLTAEKYWMDSGLGRGEGGRVSEDVLTGRRARLPATLAGIWPGKAPPPPRRPAGARPPQPAASSGPSPPATSASATPAVKSDGPVAPSARVSASGSLAVPATKANAPRPNSAPPVTITLPAPNAAPPAQPRQAATGTIARPQPPFVALPQPRKAPAPDPPRVPEGTLGNTVRPGIWPWFSHAAVRVSSLERLTGVRAHAVVFDKAFTGAGATEQGKRTTEERGVWIPHHLKSLVVPPRSSTVCITPSVTQDAIRVD
ncbi:hypothetical protein L226DRAFT_536720 [Lentinus tigrinus ALCF2SS1-7]|uniref:Uncharacterized protein n=1 Tax=Lentinus tigrinus ALCF2SS1-6 TaxID=1328759 RepID=A0A5C2S476_9APHY|nr:hypothetical protein L227DRAFT_613080 [Lentinus tigrinus ALCF2SS1-6]RPD72857.1 hypothetical protein L226DRAFT_536720 [Lentinus tigrinus ALCF2SS1-7]